jgi:adenylate cyclase
VTGERIERRLAAILAADVVGYSRLMGADEVGTLRALKTHRREIVDPALAEHGGRIVKTTGDGILVEFASVVDAVNCAIAMQAKMSERKETTASKITFRVGINIGDIIIDRDDIFGDGANIASRVESECEPGGVYLSGSAFDQVPAFAFDYLGEKLLKNIDRPVRLYRVGSAEVAGRNEGGTRHQGSTIQIGSYEPSSRSFLSWHDRYRKPVPTFGRSCLHPLLRLLITFVLRQRGWIV